MKYQQKLIIYLFLFVFVQTIVIMYKTMLRMSSAVIAKNIMKQAKSETFLYVAKFILSF